jgi:peptide/nickel transport system substrate-binding protein
MSVIAACGGDDDDGGGDGGGGGGAAKEGGSITISETSQPDFMDPALSYTVNGIEPLWLVYTPLLTYPRTGDAEKDSLVVPGLAEDMPTISQDGKTYELTLRKGLKYSDGSPVKASDFEHTIQRVLNLESGGSAFFLGIKGAEDYVKKGDAEADIPGIESDDKAGTVTITLNGPDGTFSNVLAMPFAALVPGDTPFKNMTKDPPPGVGQFKVTESVPNRQFVLEKNKFFPDIPDDPPAHLDKITALIVKNAQKQAQDVISGKLDYMQDPPPADIKPEVKAKYSDRYKEVTTASTYYFFMNSRTPPFDDPKVREAVNWGIDKPGLARIFAGETTPGCSFLPPGMPGYDEDIDVKDCPFGDPNKPPDLEKARQMIKDAGVDGMDVTVWGNNDDPTDKVTEAYADMLTKMGFNAKPKILDGGVYFQTIGNQKTKAQTGFANWFQDFPHPKNFMFLVDGASIQPTNNQNYGNTDDPEITKGIAELNKEPEITSEVADKWKDLNDKLVERAWIAPYGHRKLATFFSERMDFDNCSRFHPVWNNDYTSWCLK